MKRIHDSLRHVFLNHRIVFWYDATGEWAQTFEAFDDSSVTKVKVAGNEFGTKVLIVRDSAQDARFLLYFKSVRPADADNWLLDLLLQGHEFRADKASLIIQDVGLPHEYVGLAEEHADFFRNQSNAECLKKLIEKGDSATDIRLKMIGVLAGTEVDVDSMLLRFLDVSVEGVLLDPVDECLNGAALTSHFWKKVSKVFEYPTETPTLRDFTVTLFRVANPLDKGAVLKPHARAFIQRWQDSQKYCGSFERWAFQMEKELQVENTLNNLEGRFSPGDSDTFEIFDKYALHQLCLSFSEKGMANDLQAVVRQRRTSFWYKRHENGYLAIALALDLRELIESAELSIDSPSAGFERYVASWWKIDATYRKCIWNLRKYGQTQLMEKVSQWVEKTYVNNFLLPLSDRWSDQISRMSSWGCENIPSQRHFFELYVRPFLDRGQKVFVIISDALRFEASADFAERLCIENRWSAEVESVLGSLPSYTQLGMAALLPGTEISINPTDGTATLDGRSTTGTLERGRILGQACNFKAMAIQATDFLELNSKTEGRDLMRDNDVIYIYHATIDTIGHSVGTEAKTFDAVEQAFEELELIVKKVANINGTNMLLTSDHGFLFQQDEVDEGDSVPIPKAGEIHYRDRRFILGKSIVPDPSVKVFGCEALGIKGDWSAAFPLSLGRFPLQGSGKRFVHGGSSLQEVVVPVVKIHKARVNDTNLVDVVLLHVPTKITTGQFAVTLFQNRPATDKTLPRTLRIGLYSKDGIVLSGIKTLVFESKDPEARMRETPVVIPLLHAADAFNNGEVLLRLEETLQGTNQTVVYREHTLKLQKSFTSDFNE